MEKATLIGMCKAQIWEATVSEGRKKTDFQEIISRKCFVRYVLVSCLLSICL